MKHEVVNYGNPVENLVLSRFIPKGFSDDPAVSFYTVDVNTEAIIICFKFILFVSDKINLKYRFSMNCHDNIETALEKEVLIVSLGAKLKIDELKWAILWQST
mgnify:CR=1 FL=1